LNNHTSEFDTTFSLKTLRYWVYGLTYKVLNFNSSKPMWDLTHIYLIDLNISHQVWVSLCPQSFATHLLLPQLCFDTTVWPFRKGSPTWLDWYIGPWVTIQVTLTAHFTQILMALVLWTLSPTYNIEPQLLQTMCIFLLIFNILITNEVGKRAIEGLPWMKIKEVWKLFKIWIFKKWWQILNL
jgi:hypothetical protein